MKKLIVAISAITLGLVGGTAFAATFPVIEAGTSLSVHVLQDASISRTTPPITTATVSISEQPAGVPVGSLAPHRILAEWQKVLVDRNGEVVFRNLTAGFTYLIEVSAPGYKSGQKEITKKANAEAVTVFLVSEGSENREIGTGSVRVAVIDSTQTGRQGGVVGLSNALIEIYKSGVIVAKGSTKGTEGKGGLAFTGLNAGSDYSVLVRAEGHSDARQDFTVTANQETWLPISPLLIKEVREVIVPGVIKGVGTVPPASIIQVEEAKAITPEEASDSASKATGMISVTEVIQNETVEGSDGTYTVAGQARGRLFFIFPVGFEVTSTINARTGAVMKVQRPWWSFLAR